MNIYFILIITFILASFTLEMIAGALNLKNLSSEIPDEFRGFYDPDKYIKSQNYLRENTRFGFVSKTIVTLILLGFIVGGGFNLLDLWARSFGFEKVGTALLFFGALFLLVKILDIPFSLYQTFVIEARYGFNQTNLKTFFFDIFKGLLLTVIIGSPILLLILWFFETFGNLAWFLSWIAVLLVQVFIMFVAPVWITPLFNKFKPLEEGELKNRIQDYCLKQDFKMQGIFKMDGSKRSTKANAYFTGFGRFKRIVLFDTLIEKHTVDELVSVLAHEIGHYKMRHIQRNMIVSFLLVGFNLFLLSFFIKKPELFEAFKMDHLFIYCSFVFFGILYMPLSILFDILISFYSRKYEFEADRYSAQTENNSESMISALKKLSTDTLSNLTPHPLKVILGYSHPPVLERIRAIRNLT